MAKGATFTAHSIDEMYDKAVKYDLLRGEGSDIYGPTHRSYAASMQHLAGHVLRITPLVELAYSLRVVGSDADLGQFKSSAVVLGERFYFDHESADGLGLDVLTLPVSLSQQPAIFHLIEVPSGSATFEAITR